METARMSLTGNEAAAWAVRRSRVSVATSFPMGPNQEVAETLQKFIDNGEAPGLSVIIPDNEKAASSLQIGAARLGVRTMFCVNSEGILWAASEIHYAACSRLPMLIVCPSRALEPPTTVYCDHDDFISQRDMGWLMFYCEDAQDVFDTVIQAYKVIENHSVMLPAIVGYDGWETSHASQRVNVPAQESIDAFLPAPDFIKPEKDYLARDWKQQCSERRFQEGVGGPLFMDIRYQQKTAEKDSAEIITSVGNEYRERFGGRHVGLIETHECHDAELVIVTMGIVYPSVKYVVDALRRKGLKIGCVKLRVFRPFPSKEVVDAVGNAKLIITLDRNSIAALFSELGGAFYSSLSGANASPMLMGKVIGVGGAPITLDLVSRIIEEGIHTLDSGKVKQDIEWLPLFNLKFDPTRHVIGE